MLFYGSIIFLCRSILFVSLWLMFFFILLLCFMLWYLHNLEDVLFIIYVFYKLISIIFKLMNKVFQAYHLIVLRLYIIVIVAVPNDVLKIPPVKTMLNLNVKKFKSPHSNYFSYKNYCHYGNAVLKLKWCTQIEFSYAFS